MPVFLIIRTGEYKLYKSSKNYSKKPIKNPVWGEYLRADVKTGLV